MPCTDCGPDYSRENLELKNTRTKLKAQKEQLDTYARLLCFACEYLPTNELEKLFRVLPDEEHGNAGVELKVWWEAHQEFDRQRKQKEDKEKAEEDARRIEQYRKDSIKTAALRKLSAEERAVLGLP